MYPTYSGLPIFKATYFAQVFKLRYEGPGNQKGVAGFWFSGKGRKYFYSYDKMSQMLKDKKKKDGSTGRSLL